MSLTAFFNSNFEQVAAGGENQTAADTVGVTLAASIANAAEFVPPQPVEQGNLRELGSYSLLDDSFVLEMPFERQVITRFNDEGYFEVQNFEIGSDTPYQSYFAYLPGLDLREAAGEILDNSAIGWPIVLPEEGLYLSTLLNASPWGNYPESQFSEEGGVVYGFLAQNYNPVETSAQYLEVAAALELAIEIDGLPATTIGTHLDRSTVNDAEFDFYIEFEGRRMNIETGLFYRPTNFSEEESLEAVNPTLKITNQDGVVLDVIVEDTLDIDLTGDGDSSNDNIVGSLVYNGTEYGTIERVKGLTIIRYIDGSGASLE